GCWRCYLHSSVAPSCRWRRYKAISTYTSPFSFCSYGPTLATCSTAWRFMSAPMEAALVNISNWRITLIRRTADSAVFTLDDSSRPWSADPSVTLGFCEVSQYGPRGLDISAG